MLKILLADDDTGLRESLSEHLSKAGFKVLATRDGVEAAECFEREGADLCLLDVDMPGKDGLTVLKEIKAANPAVPVIMLTAYSNVPDAVSAVKNGAYNYLSKPIAFEELTAMIKRASDAKALVQKIALSAPLLRDNKTSINVDTGKEFLAKSDPMRRIFGLIERLAKVETSVLIRGESGTGKELVARALHFNSPRKEGKFVAVNCSAIPENLIESELFGHEKGAFTGATERKIGKFQFATGGTLFLDEIGDISPMMQVKLLRVLQDKKFTPVGSNRDIEADVRIVAATNRNLEEMMKEAKFREDLFYRLNVLPIFLPPLRDRLEDIDMLVKHFVKQFNERHNRSVRGAHPTTLSLLKSYAWPGNIRELENVVERCFVLEANDLLMPENLPKQILESDAAHKLLEDHLSNGSNTLALTDEELDLSDADLDEEDDELPLSATPKTEGKAGLGNRPIDFGGLPSDYHAFKDAMEKEFIVRALKASKGRINQTARDSGIPKKTLLRKIAKYEIDRKGLVDEV